MLPVHRIDANAYAPRGEDEKALAAAITALIQHLYPQCQLVEILLSTTPLAGRLPRRSLYDGNVAHCGGEVMAVECADVMVIHPDDWSVVKVVANRYPMEAGSTLDAVKAVMEAAKKAD